MAEFVIVSAALLAVIIALQYAAGAFHAEFAADDSSHYVSGLLVYSYLLHGIGHSPFVYLRDFHSHYPIVGIGHWGPLYYLVEGAWMLAFSHSRGTMLLLPAAVTAATAITCYGFVLRRLGRAAALFAAFALALSPIGQEASSELMLDMPVALLCLAAMMAYERFLATGAWRYSGWFGLFAAAGLLIKGNALCLALLPPFAVLFGRRWDLLRRPSFWLPAPIVGVVAGPWYALTYGLVEPGFRYHWGLHYSLVATVANSRLLLACFGPLVLACGLVGLVAALARRGPPAATSWAVAAAALFAAVWVFQAIVPVAIQDRYLLPALPPLLILAVWGARLAVLWGSRRLSPRWLMRHSGVTVAGGLALLALSVAPGALQTPVKPKLGLIDAAQQVWRHYDPANPAVLVATDGSSEEAAVAELAMADPRPPSLFAVRGSRLLGGGGYNNQDYRPRFQTPQQVMAAIDRYAIPYVLFAAAGNDKEWAHLRQITQARRLFPERWQVVYRGPAASPEVLLFRIRGNAGKHADVPALLELSAPHALK